LLPVENPKIGFPYCSRTEYTAALLENIFTPPHMDVISDFCKLVFLNLMHVTRTDLI
jgi:hypothetical protein